MKRATDNTSPGAFLCHRATGKPFVRLLREELVRHGIDTWMDERELHLSESLPAGIAQAICARSHLLVCFSGPASPWMLAELAMATKSGAREIPLLLGEATPDDICEGLQGRLYGDLRCPGRYDFELSRLLATLAPGLACELELNYLRKDQLASVAQDPAMTPWVTDYVTYCVDPCGRLETGFVHKCAAPNVREHNQFRIDPVERYWAYQVLSEIATPAAVAVIERAARDEKEPFAKRGVCDALSFLRRDAAPVTTGGQ